MPSRGASTPRAAILDSCGSIGMMHGNIPNRPGDKDKDSGWPAVGHELQEGSGKPPPGRWEIVRGLPPADPKSLQPRRTARRPRTLAATRCRQAPKVAARGRDASDLEQKPAIARLSRASIVRVERRETGDLRLGNLHRRREHDPVHPLAAWGRRERTAISYVMRGVRQEARDVEPCQGR